MITKKINRLGEIIVLLIAFLMPLFFLTNTLNFFEFNKLYVLTIVTIVLGVLKIIKLVTYPKVDIIRSKFDLPLFLLLVVAVISSVLAFDKGSSMYGNYNSFYPSLFGFLVLISFFYMAAGFISEVKLFKSIVAVFSVGLTLSTLATLLSYYFPSWMPFAELKSNLFTPSGNLNDALLTAILGTMLSLYLITNTENLFVKAVSSLALIINYFYTVLRGDSSAIFIIAATILTMIVTKNSSKFFKKDFYGYAVMAVMLIITLVSIVPTTRKFIMKSDFPQIRMLSLEDSWFVTTSTLQSRPLFGAGMANFYITYRMFKPASINLTPLWNATFFEPNNEFLNVLASTGIIGFVVFAFLIFTFLKEIYSSNFLNKNVDTETTGLIKILFIVLISNFFVNTASVLNTFYLFLIMTLYVTLKEINTKNNKVSFAEYVEFEISSPTYVSIFQDSGQKSAIYAKILFTLPVIALISYLGYSSTRTYIGEIYAYKGLQAMAGNNLQQAGVYFVKAIQFNPRKDVYYNYLAQANLTLAKINAINPNLTDDDKKVIETIYAAAINSTKYASQKLNPYNADNQLASAQIYDNLEAELSGSRQYALSHYETALQLDPRNPSLRLRIGQLYYSSQDYNMAAAYFKQAILLKPDYANAHFNLATALINLKDIQSAIKEYELTLKLLPQDSQDAKTVQSTIDGLNEYLATLNVQDTNNGSVAGTIDEKPTINEILTLEPQDNQNQEPLSVPVESEQTTGSSTQ